MNDPGNKKQRHLYVSRETMTAVDSAMPRYVGLIGRMISRTDLANALVAVALEHEDEVVARLSRGDET